MVNVFLILKDLMRALDRSSFSCCLMLPPWFFPFYVDIYVSTCILWCSIYIV